MSDTPAKQAEPYVPPSIKAALDLIKANKNLEMHPLADMLDRPLIADHGGQMARLQRRF
jgi:hypothetical protein